ncbi:hypothetical protein [Stigmatella hybrida]|uniref:hypothetical protein n=1 Tax=Stigmatella hybrida TaxID=394097 RepID=UPI001CDAB9EA|nr:hypothetical protein [Stigmatella hybrida]
MKNTLHALGIGLAALLGGPASGCASGANYSANGSIYLAQSLNIDCRPGDSSMVCCIKKFPRTAMESCGAAAAEVAAVLNGVKVLNEASQAEGEEPEEKDDFANNANLPEWKQRCIKNYYACKQEPDWAGPCYDCLRRCEGQQEWPFAMCGPNKRKSKR